MCGVGEGWGPTALRNVRQAASPFRPTGGGGGGNMLLVFFLCVFRVCRWVNSLCGLCVCVCLDV